MPEVFIAAKHQTAWRYRQLVEASDNPYVILMNNAYSSVTITGLSVNGQKAGDQRLLINYGAYPIELITFAGTPAAYRFLGRATLPAYGQMHIVNRGVGWRPITQPVGNVGDSVSGTAGTGTLTIGTLPANTDTQAIAGVTFTYKTAPTLSTDVQVITTTKEAQGDALATALTANATFAALATAEDMGDGTVLITAIAPGTAGNAIALVNSTGNKITVSSATLTGGTAGVRATAAFTVATLPAAGNAGIRSHVTDATVTTFMSTVVGGGANKVPVFDDGVAWKIG